MPKSNTINILYGYINKHKNKNIYFNSLLINNLTKDISINKQYCIAYVLKVNYWNRIEKDLLQLDQEDFE